MHYLWADQPGDDRHTVQAERQEVSAKDARDAEQDEQDW